MHNFNHEMATIFFFLGGSEYTNIWADLLWKSSKYFSALYQSLDHS